ncbi:MAG: CmcJ/NvfI family oxidoreductase [Burkholderiales bacterium]
MNDANSSVRTKLNYSVDNGAPPDYYFYEPEPGVKPNPPGTDTQEVTVHNAWPKVNEFSLDREGFALKPFATPFDQYDDDAAVRSAFYADVVAFVKANTGAQRVEVFDHTIRKRDPGQQTTVQRPAVMLVHSDYTIKSGPQRVRDLLPDEADEILKRRVAFYNVWKPLFNRVEELPLGVCDSQSVAADDWIIMELKYRERTGEIYVTRHSPAHKWYYFPYMETDQALMLKTYDSETDRARFMPHSAFEDPNTPPGALSRQSIEVRTMAFF